MKVPVNPVTTPASAEVILGLREFADALALPGQKNARAFGFFAAFTHYLH
jgi:hypothetical protein